MKRAQLVSGFSWRKMEAAERDIAGWRQGLAWLVEV